MTVVITATDKAGKVIRISLGSQRKSQELGLQRYIEMSLGKTGIERQGWLRKYRYKIQGVWSQHRSGSEKGRYSGVVM